MGQEGKWLSIIDYTKYKGISISTIRRHIKSKRLKTKFVKGKYYIFVNSDNINRQKILKEEEALRLKLENVRLQNKIKKFQEEINDLKTLVMLYESQVEKEALDRNSTRECQNDNLPDLPEI